MLVSTMGKKRLILSILGIFYWLIIPASGQTSVVERNQNLRVLVLDGKPFDRGIHYGRALKDDIHKLVNLWKQDLEKTYNTDADVFIKNFLGKTNYQAAIQKWTPELWEEIKGIAAGSELDFDTIFAFQLVDEMWVLGRTLQQDHCTTIGTNKTEKNPAVVAQNLDIPPFYNGFQTLLRIKQPEKDMETLIFTFPGFIAANGINDHSVAVVVNAVQQLENSSDGLPVAFVIRGILQRRSFDDAVDFIKSIKHGAPQNYMIGGSERIGSFECSTTHVYSFVPFEGADFIYHTNHPLQNLHYSVEFVNYLNSKKISPNEYKHRCVRFEALQKLLDTNAKVIELDLLKKIFSTRTNMINNQGTFGCTVMVLGKYPELHISPGRPDEEDFQIFKFHE